MTTQPTTADLVAIDKHAELDKRLTVAVRPVRILEAVSWPATAQEEFLAAWRVGHIHMPHVEYVREDWSAVRAELDVIDAQLDPNHPLGRYLQRTSESWRVATQMLDEIGTTGVTVHSTRLYGRPGGRLPGEGPTNLEAARHFIDLADELDQELRGYEPGYVLSAEQVQLELQTQIDAFMGPGQVSVELDPTLIAKAAAGSTRLRLRTNTGFSEYDRNQLLMHEFFVHTVTGLNGREQPVLGSLARGSPRTTATQEGLATLSEMMSGSMDIERMKRISLRIIAIDMALHGADFIQVFRFFLEEGQTDIDSFTSAQRIFRGVPVTGGAAFTKDTVYLHGLLSVHTFFRWCLRNRKLGLARQLFAGKMALEDVFNFESSYAAGTIAPPRYLPPWIQRANGLAGMLAFSLFANRIRLDNVDADDLVLGLG
ncbi:MAG: flavohemoglobin expression-modulating QEGLA motif protein [Arenimonas sp.]